MGPEFIPLIIFAAIVIPGSIILSVWIFSGRSAIKKLRAGTCIFSGQDLKLISFKDESYDTKGKEVHAITIHDNMLYVDKTPTTVGVEHVKGTVTTQLKSETYGYIIQRVAKPISVLTHKASDSLDFDTYTDKTQFSFSVLDYGSLSPKQIKKLDKAIASAGYQF